LSDLPPSTPRLSDAGPAAIAVDAGLPENRQAMFFAVIVSVAVAGFATGLTIPLVSLRLDGQGYNEFVVGLMAAAPALGFVLTAPFVRGVAGTLGKRHAMLACIATSGISIWLLDVTTHIGVWFVLRLLTGAASGILIALGETLVNELSSQSRRGRSVAIYTTTFTVCQLAGPASLSVMDGNSPWPGTLSAAIHLISAGLFWTLFRNEPPVNSGEPSNVSIWICVRSSPELFAGVLFFGLFDAVMLSLFSIYGLHHGYAVAVVTLMVAVVLLGDAALQTAIGWMADRTSPRALCIGCGFLTLAISLTLPILMGWPRVLWPALAVLGAVSGGIYTLALIQVGQRYRGHALVAANASAGLAWGIGSLAGPLVAGGAALMHPGAGLPITLAVSVSLLLLLTLLVKL
jgi:MFS family permease